MPSNLNVPTGKCDLTEMEKIALDRLGEQLPGLFSSRHKTLSEAFTATVESGIGTSDIGMGVITVDYRLYTKTADGEERMPSVIYSHWINTNYTETKPDLVVNFMPAHIARLNKPDNTMAPVTIVRPDRKVEAELRRLSHDTAAVLDYALSAPQ